MRGAHRYAAGLLALLVTLPLQAQAQEAPDLNALLREVEAAARQGGQINREREARFLSERDQQQRRLREAEAAKQAAQQRIATVRAEFEARQEAIKALKTQLRENVGELDQLYAGIRQSAGDLRSLAGESLITAQRPERLDLLDRLADGRDLPAVVDLQRFWVTLLEELVESGNSRRFEADIVTHEGATEPRTVTRVGPFTAIADGRYLVIDDTGTLVTLPAQPGRLQRLQAERFEAAREGRTEVAAACFRFLPDRAMLDLAGWPEEDIFAH